MFLIQVRLVLSVCQVLGGEGFGVRSLELGIRNLELGIRCVGTSGGFYGSCSGGLC